MSNPHNVDLQPLTVIPFDLAGNLWFGQLEGEARAFVHTAQTSKAARALFERLVDELGFEHQMVSRADDTG